MNKKERKAWKNLKEDDEYIEFLIENLNSEILKKRVAHELFTYASRANFYKILFVSGYSACLILPVITSVLQYNEARYSRIITVILMGCITAVTGLMNGLKFREKWKHYRKYCEKVKQEIFYCEEKIGKYKDELEPEKILAEEIEEMVTAEGNDWEKIKITLDKQLLQKKEEMINEDAGQSIK